MNVRIYLLSKILTNMLAKMLVDELKGMNDEQLRSFFSCIFSDNLADHDLELQVDWAVQVVRVRNDKAIIDMLKNIY